MSNYETIKRNAERMDGDTLEMKLDHYTARYTAAYDVLKYVEEQFDAAVEAVKDAQRDGADEEAERAVVERETFWSIYKELETRTNRYYEYAAAIYAVLDARAAQ